MRLVPMFAVVLLLAQCSEGNDLQAATEDRTQFPPAIWNRLYYFSFEAIHEPIRSDCIASLNFVLASTSFVQHVEQILPVRVTETLYRIDVEALGWDLNTAWQVLAETPYRRNVLDGFPVLVNHPAWFVLHLSDATESDSYYRLMFGASEPKRNDVLARFKTNEDVLFLFSKIEGKSGVSVAKRRWLVNFPTAIRTDIWGTLDSFEVTTKTDPVGNLDYVVSRRWKDNPVHDGEEWIAGLPKFSSTQGTRGRLQAYFIGNAQGAAFTEAPARLVYDSTAFRGHGAIVNFGGCIGCHVDGLNVPTLDAFQQYTAEATAYTPAKETAYAINQSLLVPVETAIAAANAEYSLGVEMCTGLNPKDFVAAYLATINWYDSPVDIEQAARELYCSVEDLRLSVAYRQMTYSDLAAGLAQLAGGGEIPRTLWEDLYATAAFSVQEWKESQIQ